VRSAPRRRPPRCSQVRYALFDGEKFKKPAYESAYEARRYASSRDVIVEIGVRGTTVVSIKMVG
jgi:hypothetical protein